MANWPYSKNRYGSIKKKKEILWKMRSMAENRKDWNTRKLNPRAIPEKIAGDKKKKNKLRKLNIAIGLRVKRCNKR